MPLTPSAPRKLDIVIPDCCNIGVVLRALAMVNGAVLAALLVIEAHARTALQRFVESSALVELSTLASLVALCGARRIVRTIPPWGQRIACALVPAAVTVVVVAFMARGGLTEVTPWAGMLVAGLFGIVLQHYLEMRTLAFSPALTEARLQALQARIRPHFLFNSLNAVLALIRTEPRRAEETLEDLADLFRVLMRDARDVTSLEDEVRLCRQYLSIEKIRLGDRLQVDWQIEDDGRFLREARIPALLLQPLVENAVHYGVEPARTPVTIAIRIARTIDRVEIAVVNPVHADRAHRAGQGNHMALDNIRERLALLHDVEAGLAVIDEDGRFEVRLRFPYTTSP